MHLLWTVFFLLLTAGACTSPQQSTTGLDEFVGRPAESAAPTNAPPARHGALWYRIEPGEETLRVRMRLLNPPSTTTFFLPGPWAGHGDFDRHIILGHARGPEGPVPITVDRALGRIDIDTQGAEWIDVSYRIRTVSLRRENSRFHPWMTSDAFFVYAPTILILPSAALAEQLRDIPVEVHLPSDWTFTATWAAEEILITDENRKVAGFIVDDVRSLRDAFVGAGRNWSRSSQSFPGGRLTITMTDDFALDEEDLLEAASTIVEVYMNRFGLYEHLTGVLLPNGGDAPDALRGMGRRGGFVLEIPIDQPLDDDLLLLLAHEAFHSWNGHQLVPDPQADDETLWFKEGVTHYIALKTLGRLGLLNRRALRREMATAAQFYLRNPIVAGGTVRAVDRARHPYDHGLLIALALDIALFEVSDGVLGVEDWIGTLLSAPFVDEARAYDSALLRAAFGNLSADLGAAPLERYDALVRNNQTIDIPELFAELGLHYLGARDGEPSQLLPIDDAELFEALFTPPSTTGPTP